MSDLTLSRDHAQRMANAKHKPDCQAVTRNRWGGVDLLQPDPNCSGCVTDREREQWQQQANELQAYIERTTTNEETLL